MKSLTARLQALFVALLLGCGAASAQGIPQGLDSSSNYRLGPGDSIRISVFQNADLTLETRVSEDGTINYPLVGKVAIGYLDIGLAEKKVAKALLDGGFLKNPQVSIQLLEVRGNKVSVLGQVNKPGSFPLVSTNIRVSQAIAEAGGLTTNGDDRVILTGSRNGVPFRREVDIDSLFRDNRPENDVVLVGGDSIYVPRAPMFYIYGEVTKPGQYRIDRNMTMRQAIAAGGGLTLRGSERRLRVVRPNAQGVAEKISTDLNDPGDSRRRHLRQRKHLLNWYVLSLFHAGDGWIPSYVQSPAHRFTMVEPTYSHDRSRLKASLRDWRDYLWHGLRAWPRILLSRQPAGVITVFPQLTLVIGLLKRLTFSRKPVVAWMFNIGQLREGKQLRVARFAYAAIDRFVVHSTHEVEVYSRWLDLPRERFIFVPLSVAEKPITVDEDEASPFLLSMGTANRDYASLLAVLADLPYPALIVAGAHALEGLPMPPNVRVQAGLSEDACRDLCQRARLSIVPLKNLETAAGQVTVVEGMMSGRPVISTRSVGTVDYVEPDVDGVLVDAGDTVDLRRQIERLWNDAAARRSMCVAARNSALRKFTFRAVAEQLETILDEVASGGDRGRLAGATTARH